MTKGVTYQMVQVVTSPRSYEAVCESNPRHNTFQTRDALGNPLGVIQRNCFAFPNHGNGLTLEEWRCACPVGGCGKTVATLRSGIWQVAAAAAAAAAVGGASHHRSDARKSLSQRSLDMSGGPDGRGWPRNRRSATLLLSLLTTSSM